MSFPVEPIAAYVKRNLKAAGSQRFGAIAEETGVKVSFIHKFVYGSRPDPRTSTIQPLLSLFVAIDRGERALPQPKRTMEAA